MHQKQPPAKVALSRPAGATSAVPAARAQTGEARTSRTPRTKRARMCDLLMSPSLRVSRPRRIGRLSSATGGGPSRTPPPIRRSAAGGSLPGDKPALAAGELLEPALDPGVEAPAVAVAAD